MFRLSSSFIVHRWLLLTGWPDGETDGGGGGGMLHGVTSCFHRRRRRRQPLCAEPPEVHGPLVSFTRIEEHIPLTMPICRCCFNSLLLISFYLLFVSFCSKRLFVFVLTWWSLLFAGRERVRLCGFCWALGMGVRCKCIRARHGTVCWAHRAKEHTNPRATGGFPIYGQKTARRLLTSDKYWFVVGVAYFGWEGLFFFLLFLSPFVFFFRNGTHALTAERDRPLCNLFDCNVDFFSSSFFFCSFSPFVRSHSRHRCFRYCCCCCCCCPPARLSLST